MRLYSTVAPYQSTPHIYTNFDNDDEATRVNRRIRIKTKCYNGCDFRARTFQRNQANEFLIKASKISNLSDRKHIRPSSTSLSSMRTHILWTHNKCMRVCGVLYIANIVQCEYLTLSLPQSVRLYFMCVSEEDSDSEMVNFMPCWQNECKK